MTSNNRKKYFFDELEKFYNPEGFTLKKSLNSFSKKDLIGNELIISYEVWPNFMQIQPSYEILIKEVEIIKKKAWGSSYDKFCSVGKQLTYLIDDPEESTSFTDTKASIIVALEKEQKNWHKIANFFFIKYSDIDYLDKILNTELGKNLDITYNKINASFLAVIVAYLTKNKKINEILDFYSEIVNHTNNLYNEDYKKLKGYLESKL